LISQSRGLGDVYKRQRLYTSTASNSLDSSLIQRDDWVWDSPFWGDQYTTHYYYGFEWF
jgi:hypothetical protein